jgi:hypothetical protein
VLGTSRLLGALSRKRGLATTSRASPRPKAATRDLNNIVVVYTVISSIKVNRDIIAMTILYLRQHKILYKVMALS